MVRTDKVARPNVYTVNEEPVVTDVIEKKDVEVHRKPVVREIHEQKVIQLEKPVVVQEVKIPEEVVVVKEPVKLEQVDRSGLGAEKQILPQKVPKVTTQEKKKVIDEKEEVAEIIEQKVIERHIQPNITEVRESKVIEEVQQPIVRKILEKPVIVEIPFINQDLKYTLDSGVYTAVKMGSSIEKQPQLEAVSCAGKENLWGVSREGNLYHLARVDDSWEWLHYPVVGIKFVDLSVVKGGLLFAISLDGLLYRVSYSSKKNDLIPCKEMTRKLISVSAPTTKKIYVIDATHSVFYLSTPLFGDKYEWNKIGEGMRKISVGGKHLLRETEVWSIGMDNRLYRYHNDKWYSFEGIQPIDVSVSVDNAVYCIDVDGRLYKWDGQTTFHKMTGSSKELSMEDKLGEEIVTDVTLSHVCAYKERKQVYVLEKGSAKLWQIAV
jgi:hypothetical protein